MNWRDPSVIFTRKLTGAFAHLFANGCTQYMAAVFDTCNDTPDELPVWCGLSPQQRLRLAKEVMLGLLCEDEPLDRIQTDQHFVAYMGIWKMIICQLEIELDCEGPYDYEEGGAEIEAIQNSCPSNQPSNTTDNINGVRKKETQQEREERLRKYAIRSKIASREKKKLEKKINQGVDISTDEEVHISNTEDEKSLMDEMNSLIHRHDWLFQGGPPPQSSRTYLRPEEYDDDGINMIHFKFRWRLLCDDALQEHDEPSILCPIPLRDLNFNWKFNDGSWNTKWERATFILFIETGLINYSGVAEKLLPLHLGELTNESYANPKNHQRVVDIKRTIQEWRDPFDETFDESQFFQDQRCIFSVCSTEIWGSECHGRWLAKFISTCQREDFSIDRTPGNYQKRLDVYRTLEDFEPPTEPHGHCDNLCPPREYQFSGQFAMPGYSYESCNADGCFEDDEQKLSKCAGCKIVKYCSRKCQKKDWPQHKKDCKALAAMYQDKDQVSSIRMG